MRVIVHYPETEKQKELMAAKIAEMHSDAVIQFVNSLQCGIAEKTKILDMIVAEVTGFL